MSLLADILAYSVSDGSGDGPAFVVLVEWKAISPTPGQQITTLHYPKRIIYPKLGSVSSSDLEFASSPSNRFCSTIHVCVFCQIIGFLLYLNAGPNYFTITTSRRLIDSFGMRSTMTITLHVIGNTSAKTTISPKVYHLLSYPGPAKRLKSSRQPGMR